MLFVFAPQRHLTHIDQITGRTIADFVASGRHELKRCVFGDLPGVLVGLASDADPASNDRALIVENIIRAVSGCGQRFGPGNFCTVSDRIGQDTEFKQTGFDQFVPNIHRLLQLDGRHRDFDFVGSQRADEDFFRT